MYTVYITAGVSEITEVFGGDHQLRDVPQDARPAQIRQIRCGCVR